MQAKPLTILSWGLGQESTDILVRIVKDKSWEARFRNPDPRQDVIAVFSDTGAEWPSEYEWAGKFIEKFLKPNGIQTKFLVHEDFQYRDLVPEDVLVTGFHAVPPLVEWYTHKCNGIPTRARSSCTDKKKIQVIRRYVNHLTREWYGIDQRTWLNRAGEPHKMIIGFGGEEGTRVAQSNVKYIENIFPLFEEQIPRSESIKSIASVGLGVPHKSGCFCCPHQNVKWYWSLREQYADLWEKTVAMEANALQFNPKMFIRGKQTIDLEVAAWEAKQEFLPDPAQVLHEAYITKSCW